MWLLENAMDGIERLFCSTKQAKTCTSTDKEHFVHYNNIFWCYMVEYSSLTANIHYNKKDLGQNIWPYITVPYFPVFVPKLFSYAETKEPSCVKT